MPLAAICPERGGRLETCFLWYPEYPLPVSSRRGLQICSPLKALCRGQNDPDWQPAIVCEYFGGTVRFVECNNGFLFVS